MKYNHEKIEKKWQRAWRKHGIYKTKNNRKKPKCYVLDMFPYPSGDGLHVGHPKGYIATDIYSRFKTMSGFNILHPMGWDAFGLPAENFAIKNKIHPRAAVKKNIQRFKEQLSLLGFNYDWGREINTTDPEYYRWTQWIFLQLFKKELAYESYEPINWCPSCQTGLANEDLDGNRCERCGAVVKKRPMRQWMLRITQYADRLLKDLEQLDWPESIKEAQRNWIGRSEGAEIDFPIAQGDINKIILMHGKDTNPSQKWYPWLIQEAKKRGIEIIAPALPKANDPVCSEWIAELSKTEPDENTVLVGHSRGGVTILRWLETLTPNRRVKKVILIGANSGHSNIPKNGFFSKEGYNFNKIKSHCDDFVVFHSKDDSYVPFEFGVENAKGLDARFFKFEDRGHFGKLTHTVPELISEIFPSIRIFTTRPDTLFGATYVVLAPEHALARDLRPKIKNKKEADEYVKKSKLKTELERQQEKNKTGVELKGVTAINPATKEEIPIFIADYVLAHYGTGAIMAVPAHDERDFEFAKKFKLPIRRVIEAPRGEKLLDESGNIDERGDKAHTGEGILINSEKFDGMKSEEAKRAITEFVRGKMTVQYKLRDWVFSRQRYWGEPIPIIHCAQCGAVPVPEKNLPVLLPEVRSYTPTGTGESPLAGISKWVNTKCPKCKGPGKRETNTMPQWAGSSWYHLRYIDPKNKKILVDRKKEQYLSPVDMYVGGAEHATRHLIYARFWHKFLFDIGAVHYPEPFAKLQHVGLIMGEDGQKMSKRYGNAVNPDEMVKKVGADALRIYEMFMGPFDQSVAWSTEGILGPRRFLDRARAFYQKSKTKNQKHKSKLKNKHEEYFKYPEVKAKLERLLHKTIKKVTEDIEQFRFNTAISQLMILLNEMEKTGAKKFSNKNSLNLARLYPEFLFESFLTFLKLLAPFAPHLSEELYQQLRGHTHIPTRNNAESQRKSASGLRISAFQSIHKELWPTYDPKLIEDETIELIIQINGKVRDKITVPAAITQQEAEALTFSREKVKNILGTSHPRKVIFVPKRLINIVP